MYVRPIALAFATSIGTGVAQGHPWTNVGQGKPGAFGTPILAATPLAAGKTTTIQLSSARGGAAAFFVLGLRRQDTGLLGGTLVPAVHATAVLGTGSGGRAALTIPVPSDRRFLGAEIYVQSIIADPGATQGAAFSNALANSLCRDSKAVVEEFANNRFLDFERSAGSWGNGRVEFSPIGGNGRHGDFDPLLGKRIPGVYPPTYEWNTDRMVIPGTHTQNGRNLIVTDGRFYFSKFEIPEGIAVRFAGSNPARIRVQGTVRILGVLQANGGDLRADAVTIQRNNLPQPGELGSLGGAAGGRGGQGADRGNGDGIRRINYQGRDGQDVQLLAGHAYHGRQIGSGGRGSPQHPVSNRNRDIGFAFSGVLALEMNRGGGGGGFTAAGDEGFAWWDPAQDPNMGRRWLSPGRTPGGIQVPFPTTFPKYTNGFTRQDHFLVGGSGGGGGGSCCGGAVKTSTAVPYFQIGRGGSGGGGAIGLRIGHELVVGPNGAIQADGGNPAFDDAPFNFRGRMTPGGAGSGGSVFVQVNGRTDNQGLISTRGGHGGATVGNPADTLFRGAESRGGDGAPGMIFFEVNRNPNGYAVGTCDPVPRAISGLDPKVQDELVGVRSVWYPVDLNSRPEFLRYELEVTIDGTPMTFSDNPLYGQHASGPSSPLRLAVQGAQLIRDSSGHLRVKPGTKPTPYSQFVGPFGAGSLSAAGANGFRFSLVKEHLVGRVIEIKRLRIVWCD